MVSRITSYNVCYTKLLRLNAGICAAPESYPLESLLLAHKLTCKGMPDYYPDMLLSHDHPEVTLETVSIPQREPLTHPADMESHAVFKAASRFMGVHQMLFAKIVSDHFEPERRITSYNVCYTKLLRSSSLNLDIV